MMKCHIAGPRSTVTHLGEFEQLSIDVNLEALPRDGQLMMIDGEPYVVEACTWSVITSTGERRGPGWLEAAQINVMPRNDSHEARPA
ncbi:MAG: hypothetical protein ACLPUO_06375 [Streptosporangiaceae bacterium]|jgi:hypothetical protein